MFRRSNPNIAVQELPKPWDIEVIGDNFEPDIPVPETLQRQRKGAGRFIDWYFRVSADGTESIKEEGPDVYVSNHRNRFFDVFLTGVVLWGRRSPYYPAKDDLNKGIFKRLGIGSVLLDCGALFFDRDDSESREALANRAAAEVEAGHAVNFYIEETSRNRGRKLGAFASSAPAMLAVENGLDDLTLIGIGGTEGTLRGLFRRKFHVEIGKLSLDGLKAVIEATKENKALNRGRKPEDRQKMTIMDVSGMLAAKYRVPGLTREELDKVFNPTEGGKKKRGHQREKKPIDIESAEANRKHIYEVFSEQVLRPALQEIVNISYVKAGAAKPKDIRPKLAA